MAFKRFNIHRRQYLALLRNSERLNVEASLNQCSLQIGSLAGPSKSHGKLNYLFWECFVYHSETVNGWQSLHALNLFQTDIPSA